MVLGHSFHEYPDGAYGYNFIFVRLIYSFHMPLYLFIGGYLLLYTTEKCNKNRTISNYVIQRIKRLLIPFIVLTAITFIPRSLMSNLADEPVSLSLRNFSLSFVDYDYMPIPYFWFIHISFILSCFTFIIIKLLKKISIKPIFVLIFIFIILFFYALSSYPASTFFSLFKLKSLGVFFILGGIYALYAEKLDKLIHWANKWCFVLFFSLWLITFFLFENNSGFYFCSLMGICTCISLTKIMVRAHIRFFDHLKGANFLIFLLSWYFNVCCQQVLAHFITLPWYCYTVISLFFGIYIPWLGYKFLEKHQTNRLIRHTSVLLGQNFKKHSHQEQTK